MLILLLCLLITAPVTLVLTWDQGLSIGVKAWGVGHTWAMDGPASVQAASSQQSLRMLGTLLRTDKARRFLLQHTHLLSLQALLRLGFQDAASTAVCAGLMQILTQLLPRRADVRVQPDFLRPTQLQLRCILFFHLGTLLITAGMVLWAYHLEAREHPAPHPKEA